MCSTCLTGASVCLRFTWPNHLNLSSLNFSSIGTTPTFSLILSLRTLILRCLFIFDGYFPSWLHCIAPPKLVSNSQEICLLVFGPWCLRAVVEELKWFIKYNPSISEYLFRKLISGMSLAFISMISTGF